MENKNKVFLITVFVLLFIIGAGCGKKTNSIKPQNIALQLDLTESTSTQITATWNLISNANGYELRYSINSNMSEADTEKTTTTSLLIEGLTANTEYYIQVRARFGEIYSDWSELKNIKTAIFTTTIGSYNMKSIENDAVHPNNKWSQRREAFRDIVRQANNNPDILGVQESKDLGQVNDAISLLGDSYDHFLDNIEVATRWILWKKDKYTLIEGGHFDMLEGTYTSDIYPGQRYATYVRLKEKNSQKDIILFNIAVPYSNENQSLRNVAATNLAAFSKNISSQYNNIPVIIVGDYNNYPETVIDGVIGTPMVLTEKGFTDTFHATQNKLNAGYATLNEIETAKTIQGVNGSKRIDFIFYYPKNNISASDYRTIINFAPGSTTDMKTPVPSDHNPVRATLNIFN